MLSEDDPTISESENKIKPQNSQTVPSNLSLSPTSKPAQLVILPSPSPSPQSKPEPKPSLQSKSEPKPSPESKSEPKPSPQSKSEPKSSPKSKPELKPSPEVEDELEFKVGLVLCFRHSERSIDQIKKGRSELVIFP